MKKNSNIVSLMIGAAFGAVVVLSVAAATSSSPTLSYGRFQLLASEQRIFKIDTSTGQVWMSFINSPSKEFMAPNVSLIPDK
jgi:hypothetical protein